MIVLTRLQGFRTALLILLASLWGMSVEAQENKKLLFDTSHGQNPRNAEVFENLIHRGGISDAQVTAAAVDKADWSNSNVLILFSPTEEVEELTEREILEFLDSGGSMLLIFDEERRTPLEKVGVNKLLIPYGLELTEDTPVPHNCGAVSVPGEVTKAARQLPYSGGRSIKGGTVISRVYADGNYVHSAFVRTKAGGKVVVMSDGMAGLLMGEKDGVRFSGTGPGDSKYWGKDSQVFMQEVFAFLLE
ncbi:hypothetical protein [Algoriphagus sp. NG3]|uniref:hypothetical protein n=1 Tax=Algoriphagus sp. NG3 TaxID=3097546 RepID=UPI002A7EC882|nr:hypothetical protein [Algoriphagus sp. NG3]WPR76330.1 hypothetical protein SLW71_03090 [Algoriphagus sp. NG3]